MQSSQWAEEVDPDPTQTRILIYKPIWARFKPEIKNITFSLAKILMKKKMSLTHPQSYQFEQQYLCGQHINLRVTAILHEYFNLQMAAPSTILMRHCLFTFSFYLHFDILVSKCS